MSEVKKDQDTTHFIGCTFFATFRTGSSSMHDRMQFIEFGTTDNGFLLWVQDERVKIELKKGTDCLITSCQVIPPYPPTK